MRKNRYETNITDLHESLIINILSFLPVESIIRCTCVCKIWSALVSQPYFIHLYYSTQRSSSSPIQFLLQDHRKPNKLFLAQLDEASCATSTTTSTIFPTKSRFFLNFLDLADSFLKICTTCSFTGCIVGYRYSPDYSSEVYHIFNPVTGDCIVIQQSYKQKLRGKENCALVFVQRTNQLKLLIFFPKDSGDSVEIDIQTLDNTDSWRTIERLPFYPDECQFPTFVNGLYHWMQQYRNQVIYSFNAETEVFTQIQTPEHNYTTLRYLSNIGSLDGKLCICIKFIGQRLVEFWVMNEYGIRESWTRKFVISDDPIIGINRIIEPMRCLENGDIMILCRNHNAICYNPTTKSYRYIRFNSKNPESLRYKPFPFLPSLRRVLPR